ncbi:hypothetical protein SMICM304S_10503 [Streptomyces microflavus]
MADKLSAEFPALSSVERDRFLGELLGVRLLRSSLRAPATITNPADVLPPAVSARTTDLMTAGDLRLDADVRLPVQVLAEAETAATVRPVW